jgi:hypothetical protein
MQRHLQQPLDRIALRLAQLEVISEHAVEFFSALEHVDAHGVDERSGDFPRSADADVAARVRSRASGSVGHEQVVPPIMKDDHRLRGTSGSSRCGATPRG